MGIWKRGLLQGYSGTIAVLQQIVDPLIVALTGMAAYVLRINDWPIPPLYRVGLILAVLMTALVFPIYGIYRSWRGDSIIRELGNITLAWITVVIGLVVAAFLSKTGEQYSRLWLGLWLGLCWGVFVVYRVALRVILRTIRQMEWNSRRVLIAGAGELGRQVVRGLLDTPWVGMKVIGFVDDNPALQETSIEGVPVLGATTVLGELLSRHVADEVWLALPLRAEQRVREILFDLRHSTVNIRFIPDIFGFRLFNHSMHEIAGFPVLDLNMTPMVGINRVIKAVEDRFLALVILILISPVLLIIAIGVKLSSPGPIFFRQLRHGWDGKPIEIYKFRSMVIHNEAPGTITQAQRSDPRITPLGKFLRRTSFDELPQFINVLQGRMSIVGPRPHAIEHNQHYKDLINAYMQRHKVKPGITGWAQVNGWRGETDTLDKMRNRVEYDLYYIEHWSLWFDLRIIGMTLLSGFVGHNAY
ncbi:UDP-glucose:undecaprenyl-phosphate glucose-1-phosphate transferase [Gammaproteobacteria bacterium]